MYINGIVTMCRNKGIGLDNKIPWRLPEDLNRFQTFTTGSGSNAIIMGRNTWESIKFLTNRDHLILSTTLKLDYIKDGNIVKTFNSVESIIKFYKEKNYDKVWIIGGSQIYDYFMNANILDHIYITYIDDKYNCDTFFPRVPENYFAIQKIPLNEITERGRNTCILVYKQLKIGMNVLYDYDIWRLNNIHYEDNPKLYFTIQKSDGREKQTIKERLKIKQ
jgi:dihydrofolate reductase